MTRSLKGRRGVLQSPTAATLAGMSLSRVLVEEPRSGDWTNSSEWGESYAGPFPKKAGEVTSIFTNNRIVGPPRQMVLTLSRPQLDRIDPINADVYAQIVFGCGATSGVFLCDWRGSVAIPANTLSVGALAYSPNAMANYDPSNPIALRLSVALGINGASSSSPPTFTTPQFEIPPDAFVELRVPQHARRAVPFIAQMQNPDPLSLNDFICEEWSRTNQVVKSYEIGPELVTQGLALAGQTDSVVLYNYSPYLVRGGCLFELGL